MASVRRLLDLTRPDIIFLQETLVDSARARSFINVFRPSWLSCAVSSVGTSGGLLVSWDPCIFYLTPFSYCRWYLINRKMSIKAIRTWLC
jgi:hypothetical protein